MAAVLALLLFVQADPLAAQARRIEPVQDLADAPPPKAASTRSREAFDRARASLQRVRGLNQQGQARRQPSESETEGATPDRRPPPGRKPAKGR
ncbi:MAG: hypothetical protein ACT4PZ_11905 [Panacagrimonas sp.]